MFSMSTVQRAVIMGCKYGLIGQCSIYNVMQENSLIFCTKFQTAADVFDSMTQKPEGEPYLCDQISNQNLSELSSRHSPLWNYNPDTLSTQTILGYIWITIAVIGFMLNIAQIWWVLSRGKKTVIDVFIVSLAVSVL